MQIFLDKFVKIGGKDIDPFYYIGKVASINDSVVVLHDRFNKVVVISLDSISRIEEASNHMLKKAGIELKKEERKG